MLAIHREQPQKALELLPAIDENLSTYNVRLLAHFECEQYEEATEAIEHRHKNKILSKEVVRWSYKWNLNNDFIEIRTN